MTAILAPLPFYASLDGLDITYASKLGQVMRLAVMA